MVDGRGEDSTCTLTVDSTGNSRASRTGVRGSGMSAGSISCTAEGSFGNGSLVGG